MTLYYHTDCNGLCRYGVHAIPLWTDRPIDVVCHELRMAGLSIAYRRQAYEAVKPVGKPFTLFRHGRIEPPAPALSPEPEEVCWLVYIDNMVPAPQTTMALLRKGDLT